MTDAAMTSPPSPLAHLDLWTSGASSKTPCPINQHSLPMPPTSIRRQSQVRHDVVCYSALEPNEGESLQVLGQPGPQSPETMRKPTETSSRGDTKAISGEVACVRWPGRRASWVAISRVGYRKPCFQVCPTLGWGGGSCCGLKPHSLTRWWLCFVLLFKP